MQSIRYEVKCYYGQGNLNEKCKPGDLAIHTWNSGAISRDMEVNAGKTRSDIGRVSILNTEDKLGWVTVFDESKVDDPSN